MVIGMTMAMFVVVVMPVVMPVVMVMMMFKLGAARHAIIGFEIADRYAQITAVGDERKAGARALGFGRAVGNAALEACFAIGFGGFLRFAFRRRFIPERGQRGAELR